MRFCRLAGALEDVGLGGMERSEISLACGYIREPGRGDRLGAAETMLRLV